MTRLAAQEKLQYYPTPPPIVEALSRYIGHPRWGTVRLLDPCCGTGAALHQLKECIQKGFDEWATSFPHGSFRLAIETYGIEPERQRYAAAASLLDGVLNTSFFSTMLSSGTGPDGGWQLCFLNPPYDYDNENRDASTGKKTRLEVNFLERATRRLATEGILVYIVPQSVLKYSAKVLVTEYEMIHALRFPDDEWIPDPEQPGSRVSLYTQFKQVVLFARRRRAPVPVDPYALARIEKWATQGPEMCPLPLEGPDEIVPWYSIPSARDHELRLFLSGTFSPTGAVTAILEQDKQGGYKTGVWANREELAARGLAIGRAVTTGSGIGQPMAPLKNAHLAVLAAAGIVNGATLTGKNGQQVLVKGSVRKVPLLTQSEDEDAVTTKLTDTFESSLWMMDMRSGEIIRVETGGGGEGKKGGALPFTVEHTVMSMTDFLAEFGEALSRRVAESSPPRYRSCSQVPWVVEGMQHSLLRRPLGKQAEIIAANVCAWLVPTSKGGSPLARIAPVAEMATGKTFLTLASAFLGDRYVCGDAHIPRPGVLASHLFPMVVLCPPIMARKWKREAEQTIPGVKALIVKRIGVGGGSKPSPSLSSQKGGKKTLAMREEEDEDEAPLGGLLTTSFDDLADLRLFAPDTPTQGRSYSAIGTLDVAVRQIRRDLSAWREQYQEALREKRTPPRKPAHILIITTSTAKLGKDWMPIYRLRAARMIDPETGKMRLLRSDDGSLHRVPACPNCGHILKDKGRMEQLEKSNEEYRQYMSVLEKRAEKTRMSVAEWDARIPPTVFLSEQDLLGGKSGGNRTKRECADCGTPLWQTIASGTAPKWKHSPVCVRTYSGQSCDEGNSEEQIIPLPIPIKLDALPPCVTSTFSRRYPIGEYLLRRYKGVFGLLAADEMHEGSDGTALDFARQRLAAACGRVIGLTGTLSNGYSASLFRLYYMLNPDVRKDFEYSEESRWIDQYGKRQTTQKVYKEKTDLATGRSSDRRIGKPVTKEVPGFAPLGLRRVLPVSTFLELFDVTPRMPYKEYIHVVDMDEPLGSVYSKFEQEATRELGQMLACGDKSGLSSWWNGMLTYPNMPYRGWTCIVKKTQYVFASAPALSEEHVYPKEREMLSLVQKQVESGRRVLIYSENTGYYDIQPRIKSLLEQHVHASGGRALKVAILRSTTVETIDREAWLADRVREGVDVLICNPKLVKVGLDLIDFPTIVYVSIPTSTSDLRQSSRRSLRPGQTKPVEVHFLVYPTVEARLLRLMAKKMQASLMVEGKLPGEGLVSFGSDESDDGGETDMILSLARAVLSQMEGGNTARGHQEVEELEALFHQNQRIEEEQSRTIGGEEEDSILPDEPVFEPMRVETLVPLPDEAGKQEETQHPITVTIIQTAVTPASDPWAQLRAKHLVPKKKRSAKKSAGAAVIPTLWQTGTRGTEEAGEENAMDTTTVEELVPLLLTQSSLW